MNNNNKKLKISQAIIVEGKYDKIKLSSFIDGVIIVTDGFGIFKNKEIVKTIRFYALHSGIIILTDSDSSGFKIRQHIKSIVPKGKIYNLYTPEIFGKEKRKVQPSKEGKLGVEGISAETLKKIFSEADIYNDNNDNKEPVTKMDFFEYGLNGSPDSSQKRKLLAENMGLPSHLSAKALLDAVNTYMNRNEFIELIEKILKEHN